MALISTLGLSNSEVLLALYNGAITTTNSCFPYNSLSNREEGLKKAREAIRAKYPDFSNSTKFRMEFDRVDLGEGSRQLSVILDDDECYSDQYDELYGTDAALKAITDIQSMDLDSILKGAGRKINGIRATLHHKEMNNSSTAQQSQAPVQQTHITSHQVPVPQMMSLHIPINSPNPLPRLFLPSGAHTNIYQRGYFAGRQFLLTSLINPVGTLRNRK